MNNNFLDHIAWIGPLILFLIIYLVYRKQFYLLIIHLIHGKYSAEYVSAYRKFFFTHPLPQAIKDDFINHIITFFDPDHKIETFQTNQKIEFLQFAYGSPMQLLLGRRGSPDYLNVITESVHEIKVLGYDENLFDSEVRALFYFVRNRFFMGEYYFPEISRLKPMLICSALAEKYGLAAFKEDNDFLVMGNENTILKYKNTGFSVMIRYFSMNDPEITKQLKDCITAFSDVFIKASESEQMKDWKRYL